jgi:hypothetical protein
MSLEVEERDGVFTASGVVLTGVGVAELLVTEVRPVSVVFNIGYSIVDEDGGPAGAADMAADIGVRADALKMANGQEMFAIASTDLRAFFVGWTRFGGYDVDVLDLALRPGPEDVERISAAIERSQEGETKRRRRLRDRQRPPAVLSSLEAPTIYYHGHDDCYFTLETRTNRLPSLVLRRLLAIEASNAWMRQPPDLPDPGEDVAERLLDQSPAWTGKIVETTPEWVAIALWPRPWRLGQRSEPFDRKPAYWAVFDIPTKQWELRSFVG